jgi:uncharacterized protein (TIGR03790 family)
MNCNDNGETIAIASRLHRLGKAVSHQYPNHTYDRRGSFKFFDDNDASELFITAVLDGPTVDSVKELIDRSIDVDNQTFITGSIYVDPYGKKVTIDDLDYQSDILDFIDNEMPVLGLDSQLTVNIDDPYQEPTVATFENESFYWGWFNPTYSQQLFLNQNERRVFLYNADDRSACNIHYYSNSSAFDENGSDLWCNIAINLQPGYASCAGSVGEPGSDSHLRPTPFFQALHQGATLGEAFLFASKYVSWKTILIGDPLMVVNFPDDIPSNQDISFTLLPNDEVILREKVFIEESLGWAARQTRLLEEMRDRVVASEHFPEALNLLQPVDNWYNLKNEQSQTDLYFIIVSRWLRHIQQTTNVSIDQWLEDNSEKITSRLNDVVKQTGVPTVASTYIQPVGYWEFILTYIHQELTWENIFFEIEVAVNETFDSGSIVVDVSSLTDITGWKYEGQPYFFLQMPDTGFPSNFSGRRIKFVSPSDNYLRSTQTYYLRWTAINSDGVAFPGASATQQIIIPS